MPSTVDKLSSTRVKLTIEVPFSDLTPAIKRAYRELGNKMSIPGFRKGHIPDAMIDARLGRGAVLSEVINAVLPQIYADTIQEHDLTPLGTPEVDIIKLEDGQVVEFTAEVDIVPDFDLPDCSTIAVTVEVPVDLDQVVEQQITILRERFAELADVERPAATGDQVRIDLVGSQNGEVLPDATAEGLTYIVGSGEMLEGLDDALIGCAVGESRTFTSTLLGGAYEGQSADITVKVTGVQSRTLPEVDDDFAQLVSHFDTADEMRADLTEAARLNGVYEQVESARNQVLDKAIELADIAIPEGLVNQEVDARIGRITDQLKSGGMTLQDYLARTGETVEEFTATTRRSVERGVRAEILLARVADAEKVGIGQEDLTNYIFQKARENGTSPEHELQHMQEHDHMTEWMAQIRQSKAVDAMVAKAKVTDTTGQPVDVAAVLRPPAAPQE